eukprot:6205396-Amphidinium_carterae.2
MPFGGVECLVADMHPCICTFRPVLVGEGNSRLSGFQSILAMGCKPMRSCCYCGSDKWSSARACLTTLQGLKIKG